MSIRFEGQAVQPASKASALHCPGAQLLSQVLGETEGEAGETEGETESGVGETEGEDVAMLALYRITCCANAPITKLAS